jgi:hypothetical protein
VVLSPRIGERDERQQRETTVKGGAGCAAGDAPDSPNDEDWLAVVRRN